MGSNTMAATSTGGLPSVPLHSPLSAKYRDTFAYPTIKDRCPVILCKVIDHLHRERNNIGREMGAEAMEGLYKVVEELSKLRYEMQTNKPILPLVDRVGNAETWNKYLELEKEKESNPSWFTSAWLWVECYMYRRITQALNLTGVPQLLELDYFRQQKEEGFHGSVPSMRHLGTWVLTQLDQVSPDTQLCGIRHIWTTLVQVSLWGNKCDLSMGAGTKSVASGDPVTALSLLEGNILSNNSREAWECLVDSGRGSTVDIVMDNSGFELFTDLCLADFLVTSGVAAKVRMRIKDQPWFVSDTTSHDLSWTLNQLARGEGTHDPLSVLSSRWSGYLESGHWTLHPDSFWTYPHPFNLMENTDPDLYLQLSQASLVIFKGDLNYRKLVGDLNWETTATFRTALQGFLPTSLPSLRTAKADVMVGLEPGQAEELTTLDTDWMVTGQWGVIQFVQSS